MKRSTIRQKYLGKTVKYGGSAPDATPEVLRITYNPAGLLLAIA